MNIAYSDGASYVGPYDEQRFLAALRDDRVVKASVYRPGEVVQMSDRKYRVGERGNLIRIKE